MWGGRGFADLGRWFWGFFVDLEVLAWCGRGFVDLGRVLGWFRLSW